MKKTTCTTLIALAAFSAADFAQQTGSTTFAFRAEQEEKWGSNHEARVAAFVCSQAGATPTLPRHITNS